MNDADRAALRAKMALKKRASCAPPSSWRAHAEKMARAKMTETPDRNQVSATVSVTPPQTETPQKSIWASWTAQANGIQAILGVLATLALLPPQWIGPAISGIAVFTIWDRYRRSDIRKRARRWLGLPALRRAS